VTKVMSSFYEVLAQGQVVSCRPRGRFRLSEQEVLAGDHALIRVLKDGTGYIEEISPRRNLLVRPPVANIDLAVIVFSAKDPPLNLELIDRVLTNSLVIGVKPVLCLNKTDLLDPIQVDAICRTYAGAGVDFFSTVATDGTGVPELRLRLKGQISVLAGQSGVGKSRLLNSLVPGASRQTGEVSGRIGRGKHTTRHVELIALEGSGFIADTPGFSLLEPATVGIWELSTFFLEIAKAQSECRFTDCLHRDEPDCAVKEAVASGRIPESRYRSYLTILKQLEDIDSRRYE